MLTQLIGYAEVCFRYAAGDAPQGVAVAAYAYGTAHTVLKVAAVEICHYGLRHGVLTSGSPAVGGAYVIASEAQIVAKTAKQAKEMLEDLLYNKLEGHGNLKHWQ